MFNSIRTSALVILAVPIALNTAAGLNPALAQWEELAKLRTCDEISIVT